MDTSAPHVVLPFEQPLVALEQEIQALEQAPGAAATAKRLARLRKELSTARQRVLEHLSPWQRVLMARHPARPRPHAVCTRVVDGFMELHGDRASGDDPGVLAGLGFFGRRRVAVVAHGRGRPGPDGRPWGHLPTAAGLRKAVRVVELAARFGIPVLLLVDTPPAAWTQGGPRGTVDALEPAAAPALLDLVGVLLDLPPPSLAVVLGEAYGDPGVAGLVADRVAFLEHAVAAPLPPEAAADATYGRQAPEGAAPASCWPELAEALCLTAAHALDAGLADAVVPEPMGGAHRDPDALLSSLKTLLHRDFGVLRDQKSEERIEARRDRWARLRQRGVAR